MTKLEMCYDGALVMPSNYAVMNEEEMTYVEGGGLARDLAIGIVSSLIATAATKVVGWAVTTSKVKAALTVCAAAAKAVWACISSVAAFIWNTPVALAIAAGAVGIGVGIVIGYYSR